MSSNSTAITVGTIVAIGLVTLCGLGAGLLEGKKKADNIKETAPVSGGARRTRRKHRAHRNRTRRA